jgi:pyrroline-5-carboxylate reductase
MNILILGAGKMVEGILTGLMGKVEMKTWNIYSPTGTSAKILAEKVGAKAVTDLDSIKDPEWILVGCKPQQLSQLKTTIGNRFDSSLYVSLLAALSEADQLKTLGATSLIRVMPNLAVKYNHGVSLLSSNSALAQIGRIEEIFKFLGEVVKVNEDELEELTLLTGSGPAFFYEFTKNLAESFSSLTPEIREKLARKVLAGAAVSAGNDSSALGVLTDSVTSKAGVTIAVLEEWRKNGLKDFLGKGIQAGKKRSGEIREQMKKG